MSDRINGEIDAETREKMHGRTGNIALNYSFRIGPGILSEKYGSDSDLDFSLRQTIAGDLQKEREMAQHVCPPWIGYLLLNPLRRWVEHPDKIFGPFVFPGMTILEPGCGMGYFTLPLARMVGAEGRVIAVDIQPKMLAVLSRRAHRAGLSERIEIRSAETEDLGIADLSDTVDFAALIHMVHEMPSADAFFAEIRRALKPGGKALVIEPRGHVSAGQLVQTQRCAEDAGLKVDATGSAPRARKLLLYK
jgi:SAM-dependent methyltransferase